MIAALLLAAGESKRMGEPKLLLPWKGGASLIRHVLETYLQGGIKTIFVVTGGHREAIESELKNTTAQLVFNPEFSAGEMISSIQVGLTALLQTVAEAAFIAPADLPALQAGTITEMQQAWLASRPEILAPSFNSRRGHPMLVSRSQWDGILHLEPHVTLRDHFQALADLIHYLEVDDPGILNDIDTPEEYLQASGPA